MNKKLQKTAVIFLTVAFVSSIGFTSVFGYGSSRRSSGGGGTTAPVITMNTDRQLTSTDIANVLRAVASLNSPAPSAGLVLGESTFAFNNDLSLGTSNNDVVELQERLRAEGFFTFHTSTGYFGPITLEAVRAYQQANFAEIGYVTGFVGPLTRAVLNK